MVVFLWFFFSSRRRHTRCALVTGVQTCALPIFAVTMLYGLDAYPMPPAWKAASALAGTLFGAYLPDILVHNAAQKRREAIRKSLPDALDQIGRASCRERVCQYV